MAKKLATNPEMPERFYNLHIGTGELVEPEESNWYPLYKLVLDLLPQAAENPSILDVGCGTGMFAKLLQKKGYTKYLGIDFSVNRIKRARTIVPDFTFRKRNMFDKKMQTTYSLFDNIIILEVLEHIEKDLEFLRSIPENKTIIFSVPNYLSNSHVRAFPKQETVRNRYGKILEFLDSRVFTSKDKWNHINAYGVSRKMHAKIFVFKCIKKRLSC